MVMVMEVEVEGNDGRGQRVCLDHLLWTGARGKVESGHRCEWDH